MTTESAFRIAFWVLFGGVFVMRVYFSLQIRRAGERVMPDREAIKREGRGMFAIRVLMFFLLLAWLVLYAINPPWMEVLSVPFPGWLRWMGFALGLASLGLCGLGSGGDRRLICPRPQGRANDDRGVWGGI